MTVQPLRKTQEAESGDILVADQLQDLLRQILSGAVHTPLRLEPAAPESDDQEVVLDMEMDGARYLVVRLQLKNAPTHPLLSPREMEIARMVAKGYPNKMIAAVLDISSWTVCTHLRRMFAKLAVNSRAAMVARLHEEGIMKERPAFIEPS